MLWIALKKIALVLILIFVLLITVPTVTLLFVSKGEKMKHMKHLARIACLTPIEFLIDLSAFVVVPFAVPFAKKGDDGIIRLPKMVRWYDDYKYGVDGDPPWWGPEHANGKQQEYMWRVRWLLRNRINTFSHEVMGVVMENIGTIHFEGDPNIDNRNSPENGMGHSGWLFIEIEVDGKIYPCYYFVYQWGDSDKCVRIYWGWKLREYIDDRHGGDRKHAMFVMAFNPLMTFETK